MISLSLNLQWSVSCFSNTTTTSSPVVTDRNVLVLEHKTYPAGNCGLARFCVNSAIVHCIVSVLHGLPCVWEKSSSRALENSILMLKHATYVDQSLNIWT